MRTEIPIVVVNASGVPIAGASVAVYQRGTSVLVAIYQAAVGSATFTNPVTTDATGRVTGWLERGQYDCVISAPGLTTYTEPYDSAPSGDGGIDTAWIADGAVTVAKIGAGAKVTYGATPPASPSNGDEWVLPVDVANGVTWRFRFNAASASAYKWEFVGGGAWTIINGLARWRIAGGFGDLSDNTPTLDVGPSFNLPRQGAYGFEFGGDMVHQGGGTGAATYTRMTMAYFNGSTFTAFGPLAILQTVDTAVSGPVREACVAQMTGAFVADDANKLTVKAIYDQNTGFTSGLYFQNRWVRCRPNRVT